MQSGPLIQSSRSVALAGAPLLMVHPTDRSPSSSTRTFGSETPLLSVITLVTWSTLLGTGILGLVLFYVRPLPATRSLPPIQAQVLDVELTSSPLNSFPPPAASTEIAEPPPLPEPLGPPPQAPAMVALAAPSAAIEFALPVDAPARIVAATDAAYVRPADPIATESSLMSPKPLTFGQGEGKQPAPTYPRRAALEGQEGTVRIRFAIGENGRVLSAETTSASPWPLLNDAALKAVRQKWRFRAGLIRLYEVAIRFELKK